MDDAVLSCRVLSCCLILFYPYPPYYPPFRPDHENWPRSCSSLALSLEIACLPVLASRYHSATTSMVMSSHLFITPNFFSACTAPDLHQVLALKLLLRFPTTCHASNSAPLPRWPSMVVASGVFSSHFSSRVAPVY